MKRRIGVIVCLLFIFTMMTASIGFAASNELVLERQTPEDGAKGTAIENVSIKLWFNQDVRPKNEAIRKENKKHIKLTDAKGKPVAIYVAYNPKEEGQMMVLSSKSAKQNSKYTLTIDPEFQATSGARFTKGDKISFTTLNQSLSTTVNMVIMGVMIVGMIVFSSRSMKKQMEKENQAKGKTDTVNPYKEAKRTGKSVEEIVAKDKKAKAKIEAKAKSGQRVSDEEEQEPDTVRVSGPKPISAAGSTYRYIKKKPVKKENKGTTRPKNQTGKQKNTKKK